MPLHGKFVINDADYAPLTIYGVGVFMAWSGDQHCRNKNGCFDVPDKGPLPPGKYWIVDRASGGRGLSMGCITLLHKSDFQLIRTLLRHTNKVSVPRAGGLLSYGTIEAIGNGDSCP